MLCESFIISWNEADLIQKTVKHYLEFCDKVTVFDNYSDDGSDRLAEEAGAHVKKFGMEGILDDTEYLKIKNHCWKTSKAKWVIVVDADEIIYHPNLKEILEEETSTILRTKGMNVFSDKIPNNLLDIQRGAPDSSYSKYAVFSPKLREINYVYGCHVARPVGGISYSDKKVFLLHYRNARGIKGVLERQRKYLERLSPKNKRLGLGCHYWMEEEQKIKDYEEEKKTCVDLPILLSHGLV